MWHNTVSVNSVIWLYFCTSSSSFWPVVGWIIHMLPINTRAPSRIGVGAYVGVCGWCAWLLNAPQVKFGACKEKWLTDLFESVPADVLTSHSLALKTWTSLLQQNLLSKLTPNARCYGVALLALKSTKLVRLFFSPNIYLFHSLLGINTIDNSNFLKR